MHKAASGPFFVALRDRVSHRIKAAPLPAVRLHWFACDVSV